jgi:hypothetical protein
MRVQVQKVHAWLLAAIIGVAALPMVGSFAVGRGVPPMFGVFPPNKSGHPKPEFSWLFFSVLALFGVVGLAFLIAPQWFGFKERGKRCRHVGGSLPWWFWGGTLVMAFFWYAHWFGQQHWVIYSFVPLWWGFIFAIDGLVYKRTGGRSLVAMHPGRLLVITLVSIPAWAYFEFMNYYGMEFWVYPRDQFFSPLGQAVWYLISFSVVLPAIFEWYTLLHTFDGLWNRYAAGPVVNVPQRASTSLFVIGLLAMIAFGAFPFQLFVLLWLGPPLALSAALARFGLWTPFRPISKGVWSHVVIAGLASLINGVFWELWNYGSEYWRDGASLNPNFWFYEIPYVEKFHPFSEMPLLGYFGYLPFGGLAWVCWLVCAHLLNLEPDFDVTPVGPPPQSEAELSPATSP